jgi:hypothetical protein
MSQYPSPYSPPPVPPNYGYDFSYYQPQQDVLAPARRASVIMFVMGGLLAIGGLCCGAVGAMAPLDQIMSQNPTLSSTPGVTPELMQVGVIVMGVFSLLFGMALLVLGYFVRGGGMAPVVTSIVVVGIVVLLGGLMVLLGLLELSRGGSRPEMFISLCMYVLPLVLLIVLLAQLIQAAKMSSRVAMMKSQYQQQYWQYQQQQQMYQAGYVAPPPPMQQADATPPPPVPPPPPAPPSDTPSPGDPNAPSA